MHCTASNLICSLLLFFSLSFGRSDLSWTACRKFSPFECCAGVLPGTALHTLINNGTFKQPGTTLPLRDPYIDTWLRDAIPDINDSGPALWTFDYTATAMSADILGCSHPSGFAVASLEQGSYRMTLYVDGTLVAPTPGNSSDAKGMFRRFDWSLGPAASFCAAVSHELRFEVEPPDHPGAVTGGQGGNHLIAQDLISQDLAGWDWVAGVPDRKKLGRGSLAFVHAFNDPPFCAGNTGMFDGLTLAVAQSSVLLRDPTIAVMSLQRNGSSNPNDPVPLSAFVRVSISSLSNASLTGTLFAHAAGDIFSARVSIPAGTAGEWLEFSTGVVNMTAVRLWWPHTMGEPFLYNATVTFVPDSGAPVTEVQWKAGFRTVSSVVDESLQGQVFSVNGERIFLQVSQVIRATYITRTPSHLSYFHVAGRKFYHNGHPQSRRVSRTAALLG